MGSDPGDETEVFAFIKTNHIKIKIHAQLHKATGMSEGKPGGVTRPVNYVLMVSRSQDKTVSLNRVLLIESSQALVVM